MNDSGTNPCSRAFGRLFNKVRPEIWGFISTGIILACVLLSRIGYVGTQGEPYSFLNHYISELGELGVSHLAPLFNTGLVLGGLISAVFMIGLGLYINNLAARIAMAFGVISGLACSFVGFLPINNMDTHVVAASCFFFGGMITTAAFTIAIVMQKEAKIPKLLSVAGVVVMGVFIAFLVNMFTTGLGSEHGLLGVGPDRPDIWIRAILEWSVFFVIIAWVLLISTFMFIASRKRHENGDCYT